MSLLSNIENFKNTLTRIPGLTDDPEFRKFFKGPKRSVQQEIGEEVMQNEIINEDFESDFDQVEEKISVIIYSPEEMKKTFEGASAILGYPLMFSETEISQQYSEQFDKMEREIEETVYKEVAEWIIAKEFRDGGTFMDAAEAAKKIDENVYDYICDISLEDQLKFMSGRMKYVPKKLPYLSLEA